MITIHHFNDNAASEQAYKQGTVVKKKKEMATQCIKWSEPYGEATEMLPEAAGFLSPWVSNHSSTIQDNTSITIYPGHACQGGCLVLWEYIVYVSICACVCVEGK